MKRRDTLKLMSAATLAGVVGMPRVVLAQAKPKMVIVHKIAGIPWVNLMAQGAEKGAVTTR